MKIYFAQTIYCITAFVLYGCQTTPNKDVAAATPGKPNAVVALGRIQPFGEVIKLSVANAQDSRVDQILVKEGDRVQSNQVIAVLQGIERKQADLRDALTDVKLRQVELLLSQVFRIEKSRGTLNEMRQEVCAAVERAVAEAMTYAQQQKAANSDETGFKQQNKDGGNPTKKKAWLWVMVTPLVSVFMVTLSRGGEMSITDSYC